MRKPMKAAAVVTLDQDWSMDPITDEMAKALRGETESEIPIALDLSEVETVRCMPAAAVSAECMEIIDEMIEDAIDSCTNPDRRSPCPPIAVAVDLRESA